MFEKLLSRGERRFGRYFGIPKLMMILCIGMGVTYVADYLLAAYHISLSYYLMFDREAIFHGQIWRLVTFVFTPPSSSPINACTSVLRSLAILLLLIISTLQGRLVSPQNREEHLRWQPPGWIGL